MSMIPWIAYAAAAGLVGYTNPMASDGKVPLTSPRHHLRVMMENDSFFDEDNGYTHGTRFDYAQDFGSNNSAFGLSLTQNIYTPDLHTHGNVPGQHPYAGYLALGGAYMHKEENIGFAAELQVGTTGKPSFAENSQWFVHEVCNMTQWNGWADQIPAEATVQLTLRQDWRLAFLEHRFGSKYETDGTLFTREQVGTVAVGGAVGLTLRFGQNLPNSMQVSGSEAANYGMGLLDKPNYHPEDLSWFILAQGQCKFVGRDLFIDGGVFHDFEQTCKRRPWIAEFQLGVGISCQNIDYYIGGVYSSDTYKGQADHPIYGTCSVTWHW